MKIAARSGFEHIVLINSLSCVFMRCGHVKLLKFYFRHLEFAIIGCIQN